MEEMNEFRRFDLVSNHLDHHYADKKVEGSNFTNTESGVYRRIMREWKILEENLPESIYVRSYESRIDLLRAVIVGAAGTPYHDGLFFFDIQLPIDYPHKPPKLRYRSFGYILNPNIYSTGKICLSLLNTWKGDKSEKWDPSGGSTLLQVLLSIQALVLNEHPFFNEIPGLRALQRKSTRVHYNERAFINTCMTSLCLLNSPPNNFEAFVKDHFCKRGSLILLACKDYANQRVRVGYYNCSETTSRSLSLPTLNVSTDFLEHLKRIYPKMFDMFLRCGASLESSLKYLELQKNLQQSNNEGIFKKARAKVKQALGLKTINGKNKLSLKESNVIPNFCPTKNKIRERSF